MAIHTLFGSVSFSIPKGFPPVGSIKRDSKLKSLRNSSPVGSIFRVFSVKPRLAKGRRDVLSIYYHLVISDLFGKSTPTCFQPPKTPEKPSDARSSKAGLRTCFLSLCPRAGLFSGSDMVTEKMSHQSGGYLTIPQRAPRPLPVSLTAPSSFIFESTFLMS